MKTIKSKIKKVIQGSNGYPNYTRREYLKAIRLVLNEKLSKEELDYIESIKIYLDQWIMEITEEVTNNFF